MSAPQIKLNMLPIGDDHARLREEAAQQTSNKTRNCAECRRLKIKCDRKIPCQNCVKRGRASICPNGSLSSRGTRMILSNTEDLHAKIEELTARIQDLESALAALQTQVSAEPHPLLTHNQLSTEPTPRNSNDPNSVPLGTYGTLITKSDSYSILTASRQGSASFVGATSATEWVVALEEKLEFVPDPNSQNNQNISIPASVTEPQSSRDSSQLGIVPDLVLSYTDYAGPSTLGFNHCDRSWLKDQVLNGLPSKSDATDAINRYYEQVTIDVDPIPRTRLFDEFFVPCYDSFQNTPHMRRSLALLYAIFALGNLVHPSNLELAHRYIMLSRNALMMDDMVMNLSTTTIDTLMLHLVYVRLRGGHGAASRCWVILGMVVRLAQALGLHRDPSMWGLSPEETLRRRRTMWELVHLDLWSALHFGRPPMLSRQHFDVQLPMDNPDLAEAIPNFIRGKYLLCQQCLWPLLDVALASKDRTTYAAVLRVDKTIRDWVVPHKMQVEYTHPRDEQMIIYEVQRTMVLIVREIILLSLHKSYFSTAIFESPFDPLRSRYSRSVLAAYASACAILAHVRLLQERHPTLFEKNLFFGTQGFNAAVMLGSMAVCVPDCPLAASALAEFNLTVEVFKRLSNSPKLSRVLPILLTLQPKAQAAHDAYKDGSWVRPTEVDPMLVQGLGGGRALVRPLDTKPDTTAVDPTPSTSSSSAPSNLTTEQRSQPEQIGQTGQTGQMTDFDIFLENYLRSFDTPIATTSNTNESQDGVSQVPIPMHVQSSDAFLHGALTGDWARFSREEPNTMFGMSIASSMFGFSGASEVPLQRQEPQQRLDVGWDCLGTVSTGGTSPFGSSTPDTSVMSQDINRPSNFSQTFYSGISETPLSMPPGTFDPLSTSFDAFNPAQSSGMMMGFLDGNIGETSGTANDEQSTLQWDNFLKGLGGGKET